jgi:DNA-binding SARP family transcriptional activator
VPDTQLGSRKGRRLLAALAVAAPSAVSVDALVELLWPEGAPARPADQVGVLVSRLRRALGTDRVVRGDAGYALACDWCDLEELGARTREAAEALDGGRVTAARAAADAALSLGDPTVLPEEEGAWVEAARARALADVATARRVAVDGAVAAGDHRAAIAHAEALLAADPLDEAVTHGLMLAQVRSGRPAAALASYARLRSRLAEELGVSPSAEVEALHTAILTDDVEEPTATHPAPTTRLVGRDRELALLDDHLRRSPP